MENMEKRSAWEAAKAKVEKEHAEQLEDMKNRNESNKAVKKLMKGLISAELRKMKAEAEGTSLKQLKKDKKMKKKMRETEEGSETEGPMKKKAKVLSKVVKVAVRDSIRRAVASGPQVVLDMSFAENAGFRNKVSLIRQIQEVYSANLHAAHPARILLCGVSDVFKSELSCKQDIGSWEGQGTITITSQEFQDMIQPDEIVYLSSEATEELTTVESNKSYIIGGILDRNSMKGTTAAKADKLKVSSARLPLDDYLTKRKRKDAKKVLTVNQVARIIQDYAATKSWDFALDRNVPSRLNDSQKRQLKEGGSEATGADSEQRAGSWKFPESKPKTALVFGASSGIGLAFSTELRRAGWTVVMVARGTERLEVAAGSVRGIIPESKSNPSSTVEPIVVTVAEDCTNIGGIVRVVSAMFDVFKHGVDGIIASSGCFRWDDDQCFQDDDGFLWKQNFESRVNVFAETLRILDIPVVYKKKGKDPVSNFSLGKVEHKQTVEKLGAGKFFLCVGSDAGTPDFETRVKDTEKEQKYIESMRAVHAWTSNLQEQLKAVVPSFSLQLIEPPLLDTPMARDQFQRLPIDWSTIPKVENYVKEYVKTSLPL